ncbi:MAG: DUF2330 domain-containing protein [Planctomycetes bacterium]|nr:DUF2330 domain-containing protein [Planctomycetota bacterium]
MGAAHTRCLVVVAVLLSAGAVAMADGKFFSLPAYPAVPSIPSQAALIVYRDGVETLIVSSSVRSDSPELGWVLPLPAQPLEMIEADAGILPSLRWCLRPGIITDHKRWVMAGKLGLLFGAVLLGVALRRRCLVRRRDAQRRPQWVGGLAEAVLVTLVFLLVYSLFSPTLGVRTLGLAGGVAGVDVVSEQRVGIYDVAVLQARGATPLDEWLAANGLQTLDEASLPVVNDYVARGWCFVVARLAHEAGTAAAHPIAARFRADRPVFPMKLTALAASTTQVDLYVVADRQAKAPGFRTIAADRYVRESSGMEGYGDFCAAGSTPLHVGQPDVMALMWDGCVLTHLSAELTSDQMDRDVFCDLVPLRPQRVAYYTPEARADLVRAIGLLGLGVCCALPAVGGLAGAAFRWWHLGVFLGAAAAVGTAVLLTHALIETPPLGGSWGTILKHTSAMRRLVDPYDDAGNPRDITVDELEAALAGAFAADYVNPMTGGAVRRERSPGNYDWQEIDGRICVSVYDAIARRHYLTLHPTEMSEEQE